jgi:hypothetical protein
MASCRSEDASETGSNWSPSSLSGASHARIVPINSFRGRRNTILSSSVEYTDRSTVFEHRILYFGTPGRENITEELEVLG